MSVASPSPLFPPDTLPHRADPLSLAPPPPPSRSDATSQAPVTQFAIDALPLPFYTTDTAGRVTSFNRAAAELWGREPSLGHDLWCGSWRIFSSDGLTPVQLDTCPMALAVKEGRPVHGVYLVVERPDGSRRNVLPHPQPIRDPLGAIVGGSNLLIDMTDHRNTDPGYHASDAQLRAIFGQAAVGIHVLDLEGRILEANQRLCDLTGRTEANLRTLTCRDLTHPEDWPSTASFMAQVASGGLREFSVEKRYLRADDSWVWVNVTMTAIPDPAGRPVQLVSVVQDITQLKLFRAKLEEEVSQRTRDLETAHRRLGQQERLAALGTLSAGLGHDLANLILPLRTHLDALKPEVEGSALATDLESISKGLGHLQRLASGLRQMAAETPQNAPREIIDLPAWWDEARGVCQAVITRGTRLDADIPPGLPCVGVSRSLLTQVLFNLIQNAADSIGHSPDGHIQFSASRDASVPTRPMVRLTVRDNGPGMSPEILARCFEPYFSTKGRAVSTGMGLGMVRSAVIAAGGSITCDSSPGRGAVFTILIPGIEPVSTPPRLRACIRVTTPRSAALTSALLDAMGVDSSSDPETCKSANLLVLDAQTQGHAQDFIDGSPCRFVVVLSKNTQSQPADPQILWHAGSGDTMSLRALFEAAVNMARRAQAQGGSTPCPNPSP